MGIFLTSILNAFKYIPEKDYNFDLSNANSPLSDNKIKPLEDLNQDIFSSCESNLEYIKVKFNSLINSDIKIREFDLTAKNKVYKAFIVYIDGMSDYKSINRFILHPLMLKSKSNTSDSSETVINSNTKSNNVAVKKFKNFNLIDYIYSCLIPHNDVIKSQKFENIISSINLGDCALFIDTINTCFICDVKGYEKRNIDSPKNEIVIRGPHEAFVENLRTNTSMLRRIVNNENLVIENTTVGAISKTKCAICYLKDVANNDLVAEVKYRINNIDLDYIVSSGQLEELIKEHSNNTLPEILPTERPDTAATSILEGKVVIIVNRYSSYINFTLHLF